MADIRPHLPRILLAAAVLALAAPVAAAFVAARAGPENTLRFIPHAVAFVTALVAALVEAPVPRARARWVTGVAAATAAWTLHLAPTGPEAWLLWPGPLLLLGAGGLLLRRQPRAPQSTGRLLADLESEATPLRRLIAFAAVFLGLLALVNAAFARQPPLLSPPAVLAIVLLAGASGLLIWVNSRWARAVFWATAGVAALVAAGTGASLIAPPWGVLAAASVLLGGGALVAAFVAAAALIQPSAPLESAGRWGRIGVGVALAGLWWIWFPAGGGPVVALTAAVYAILLAFLLRPVEEEGDAEDGDEETGAGAYASGEDR